MAWPVYSTRFLSTGPASTWMYFTVPAGKRAVVRTIVVVQTAAAEQVVASVAGQYLLIASFPGPDQTRYYDMHVAAYSGEQLGLYRAGSNAAALMSGYLLEAPAGAEDAPAPEPGPPPPGWLEASVSPAQ